MWKSVLFPLAVIGLALTRAHAVEPALLFRADFDQGTAAPSSAAREHASCPSRPLDLEPGAGGKGLALLLEPGEDCSFPAARHLNARAGTLSFWAKPKNWGDGDSRSQIFFDWRAEVEGRPFSFYVDSPPESGTVRLVVAWGGGQDPYQRLFQISAPVIWETGHWQKIDVTWDEREIVIYGNGEAGERIPLETVSLPSTPAARFRLTPGTRGLQAPRDATALDELEIWDAALPPDRIRKRYRASIAPPLAVSRLCVPRAAKPPHVDGRMDDAAWAGATRVPLLADAETGHAGLLVPHVSLCWSADSLHVGLAAPLTDAADAFELTLGGPEGVPLSIRVTPSGLVTKEVLERAAVEVATQSSSSVWSAEVSLPLTAFSPAKHARDGLRFDLRHRVAEPGALTVGAHLASAALVLGDESEGVRITGSPDLALGRVALDFEQRARTVAEVSVAGGGKKWRERVDLSKPRELREEPDPEEGVLKIAVHGEQDREWVVLESRLAPLDVPGIVLVPDASAHRLGVELDFGWLDGRWRKALAAGAAAIRLKDRGPVLEGAWAPVPLQHGRGRASLAHGLAPGRHVLAIELSSPVERLVLERQVEVPELPWLGKPASETDGVLDPWLPLAWDDDGSVRIWNRRYRFDGPLLASVESGGRQVLREPMRLRLRTDAGETLLRTNAAELSARSASRADFRGTAELPGAGIDVRWSAWIEYDGVVSTSFTLAPQADARRIDELSLEIPLDARIARYLRGGTSYSAIRPGRVPWDGNRHTTRFEPFLWLSDEEDGFLYFAESDANWVGSDRQGAVEVRGGPDAGITLRLIDGPVMLPGPITYQLGFQATPVKPLLPGARAWNFGRPGRPTPHERAISYWASYSVAEGLWALERPGVVQEQDRKLADERAVRPFYFATTSSTPDVDPVFRLFERLWRSAWSNGFPAKARPESATGDAVPAHRLAGVCPGDASFQDRMLYDAHVLLSSIGAIGLFTDTDGVVPDDNALHGCGFTDAFGRRGVTWTILKKRRFAKRLAALVRSAGAGRRYWMSHAHSRLVPPVHGFADFWYPGEDLEARAGADPLYYVRGLDEEAWRVEYGSGTSGVVHVLLPELDERNAAGLRRGTEGLVAMAAVNDVNVSSPYTDGEVVGEYWGLRERLGLIDSDFVGHWRGDCPVRAVPTTARASFHRSAHGPVIAIANRAAREQEVEVQLDLQRLGVAGSIEARDERRGRRIEVRGDRLVVPLGPYSYTYVTVRAR